MKPRNFPAKKLRRQLIAQGEKLEDHEGALSAARGRLSLRRRPRRRGKSPRPLSPPSPLRGGAT